MSPAVPLLAGLLFGAGATAVMFARRLSRFRTLGDTAGLILQKASGTQTPPSDPSALAQRLQELSAGQAERISVAESERLLLQSVLEGMEEGIVLLDERQRVVVANRAAHTFWSRLGPLLRGRHVLELVRDVALDEAVTATLGDRQPRTVRSTVAEAPRRLLEIRVLPVEASFAASPWRGRREGLLLVIADVTERQKVEAMRRDFVANVSHELQTPLTSIRGLAETLDLERATLEPEEQARFLHLIRRETERMVALVRDLMELARLEAPGTRHSIERVEIDQLVHGVVQEFEPQAKRKSIELAVAAAPGAAPVVSANADEVRRALQNLVQNALQYTPPLGHITVGWRVEPERQRLLLDVRDDGQGIAPEHLPRLFERFYRVDAGRSRNEGGTGLGLAIVKHIAEAHGGGVVADSSPGLGSTFTIRLPYHPDGGN